MTQNDKKAAPEGTTFSTLNDTDYVQGTAFERITAALDGVRPDSDGPGVMARCPAHDDKNPSLHVTPTATRTLLHCFAGCEFSAVLDALGMTKADTLNNARTEYRYDDGRVNVRTNGKNFHQEGNRKGGGVLYRLEKVREAVKAGQPVYLVEGEEDVHALETLGVTATTCAGGGLNVSKVDVSPLEGATVVAIPDRDATGKKWSEAVWERLHGYAASLTFMEVKAGKDFSDHLAAGHGIADLTDMLVTGSASTGRQLAVQRASDIKMRSTRWLWEEDGGKARWLPLGGFTLLGGREGIGKSTIGYSIAAKVTTGTLPGAFHGQPRSVVIAATEDAWEFTVLPRLVAAGADLERVFRVDAVTQEGWHEGVSLPEDNTRLKQLCEDQDVALLLLDPLMGTINGKLDSHKDAEVRKALEPLSRLAHECQLTIVGLIHLNKSTGGDLLTRLMASRAFSAVARAVLIAAKDDDPDEDAKQETFLLGQPKNNLAAKVPYALKYSIEGVKAGYDEELDQVIWGSRIKWEGRQDGSIQDIVAKQESRKPERETAGDRAMQWLEKFLRKQGKPVNSRYAKECGANAGHTESTLKRAAASLGVKVASIPGTKKETSWSLSDPTELTDPTDPTDPTELTPGKSAQSGQWDHGSGTGKPDPTTELTPSTAPDPDAAICPKCGGPTEASSIRRTLRVCKPCNWSYQWRVGQS